MKRATRLWILGAAVAVHALAAYATHRSMVDFVAREQLALREPARIVIAAPSAGSALLARQQCPAPRVL